ncbi:hypothetical protein Y032_0003g1285 [Ancylostoma ceylanicum]|uniref:Secreted protein n=1 Tax=Ancylostoma ceylanicum TaxID=53326 RepID=A0A016VX20_9BILA|nr:hypothetical protein Y032_0003g1285 [Ancylostoma ceylanicum]
MPPFFTLPSVILVIRFLFTHSGFQLFNIPASTRATKRAFSDVGKAGTATTIGITGSESTAVPQRHVAYAND